MRLFLIVLVLIPCLVPGASPRPVRAEHGMVVSAHEMASQAGVDMMKQGGNAVDAAAAAAFVLGVVEPFSAGIGGGGFMLIREGKSGKVTVVDYREVAPMAASRDMFLDEKGNVVPERSREGHLSVAVPGTVSGLAYAVKKYGKLPLAKVLAPAIKVAEEGFPAHDSYVEKTTEFAPLLRKNAEARSIFLDDKGQCPKPGTIIREKDLARTLKAIAKEGPVVFYQGGTAISIVEEMKRHGGLVTREDLAAFETRERKPVRGTYRGYEIVSMPPPSSGGIHVIQILNILEGFPLGEWGWGSSKVVHAMAEAMRRAYADRSEYLGDPAFVKAPVDGLLSKEYARELQAQIQADKATPSSTVHPGSPSKYESPSTTHLVALDRDGNAVSLTQTINYTYGSGVVVPGTGILLNDEMDDFSAKPGAPNVFGLIGGEANSVAPAKIPLSSMSPSMVLKDGRLFMVVGTPGGARIITMVVEIICNVIDHGMNIQQAVDAPRFHHQWLPDEIAMEKRALSPDTRLALEARGHKVVEQGTWGNAQAILVDPQTRQITGASDPRGVGKPVGY